MSSHYIYVSCNYPGCTAFEAIYTGDAYTMDFSDSQWEGEIISVRCKEHENEPGEND